MALQDLLYILSEIYATEGTKLRQDIIKNCSFNTEAVADLWPSHGGGVIAAVSHVNMYSVSSTETGWGEQGGVSRQHYRGISIWQLHRALHQEPFPGSKGQSSVNSDMH